jgi:hypothetical protein
MGHWKGLPDCFFFRMVETGNGLLTRFDREIALDRIAYLFRGPPAYTVNPRWDIAEQVVALAIGVSFVGVSPSFVFDRYPADGLPEIVPLITADDGEALPFEAEYRRSRKAKAETELAQMDPDARAEESWMLHSSQHVPHCEEFAIEIGCESFLSRRWIKPGAATIKSSPRWILF